MNKKVALIEDDPLLIKMYKTKFSSEGLDVITAYDGESGLELIKKELPAVVVLDVMMPRKKGTDVLKELKLSKKTKSIPVILFSNLSHEGKAKKARELGAKEYIVKAAVTPGQVVEKVKKYL